MANEEQLSILKQGVEVWDRWREENLDVEIDLSEGDLSRVDLVAVDLREANLTRSDLVDANLREADLGSSDLSNADLGGANLFDTNLRQADLKRANLSDVNACRADLRNADLRETKLTGTNLIEAHLGGSNFSKAWLGGTIFGEADLSEIMGLDDVVHLGPSYVSTDIFVLSKGKIPEVFLRGCGLSDTDIEYAKLSNPDLSNEEINKILYKIYDLRATQALQISPLFLSHSHADSVFVDKLGDCLTKKGIRYWRDVHDMTSGRMEKQIDRAIRQNPTVLLVLSENALSSDWVEHEVRTARELEQETGRDVLCPVALDDSWKDSRWPKRIMEQIMEYNILDFSEWKDDSKFDGMFRKLIDGLELFYKG